MSTFAGHAKSLAELYVYYKRLYVDHPVLATYVNNAGHRILRQTEKYKSNSSAVRAQAQSEFSKEKQLLMQHFGVNINFDYYGGLSGSREGFKEVIDALNSTLNLKKVYQRNVQLIQNTKGQKAVYSWYPTYFMKAWDYYWPQISAEISSTITENWDIEEVLSEVLDRFLPDICVLGIKKMLDGPEVEANAIDPQLKDAYAALVSQIGKVQTAGSVANQIYEAYQLDELKKGLMESLQINSRGINESFIREKTKTLVSKNIHSRGGLSQEAIENAIFSLVAQELSSNSNINVKAIHSGSTQIKADNIITIGFDPELVEIALEQAGENRNKNIAALTDLGEKLKKLDDGFIIYSSDKNYTLNKDFSGFHAGSLGATAADFLGNVYKNSSLLNTLIGAIQQLGQGAILEGKSADFEELLAQDVAYMLFDDYSTIGQKNTGGNAIHIMNLNGIMIPMSVILTLLADAIESVDNSTAIRRVVNVKIQAPPVIYKTTQEQIDEFPQNPAAAWDKQRQEALHNTKISATFLRNFSSLVKLYL